MTDTLLTIKFFAPPLRPGLVCRPRLAQKLNQALERGSCLTLFSAPAGYGKTTQALEWLASLGRPYAWLSLDRTDSHPVQFLKYMVTALQKLGEQNPGLFPIPLESFPSDTPEDISGWLTGLINQLAAATTPFVLVLDDYHTITDLGVHQALEFLINHQAPQMHLVITTRQDPLLPLSRLRSRGQVTEIRLGDLRFTTEEATAFLNGTMHLALFDEQIASLDARTEGWIAGLQLAALSLTGMDGEEAAVHKAENGLDGLKPSSIKQQRSVFIQNFAGDDRHIMDYLLDEVLSRQSEEVQQFLLRTSILKRFCGPLCDAILEQGPARTAAGDAHAILEYLDRGNLFIIPLDNRRQWYRYHHLFSDLLANRLQSSDPALILLLHCRASLWYEREGMMADAVDHALLAEDFDRALRLIELTARTSIWASGDLPALLNWSKRLPEDVLMTRPRLCIYNARALFFIGQIESAKSHLKNAEQALKAREKTEKHQDELWGLLYTNQATFAAMQGELSVALELASRAKNLVPASDLSSHARIAHAEGVAHFYLGAMPEARLAFTQAIHMSQQANNLNLGLDAISCLAETEIIAGNMKAAYKLCHEALSSDPPVQGAPPAAPIYMALAEIFFEQNNLHAANEALEKCILLAEKFNWTHVLWQAYILKSRNFQMQKSWLAAQQAVQHAEQVAAIYHNPYINHMIAACRARIALDMGNLEAAERWAKAYQRKGGLDGQLDVAELTFASIRLAGENKQQALDVLEGLIENAAKSERMRTLMYASATKRRIIGQNHTTQAEDEAFAQAEREGFVRVFLEAGIAVPALLDSPVPTEEKGSKTALVESLSEREMEVLRLIADGLSNPEIAARLYLSVNTLRAHTTNIYQKLGVHSRIQAVTLARELGLLRIK